MPSIYDFTANSLAGEEVPGGRSLLVRVMDGGRRLPAADEPLADIRARCAGALAALPPVLRSLAPAPSPVWPVDVSPGLDALAERVLARAGRDMEHRQ